MTKHKYAIALVLILIVLSISACAADTPPVVDPNAAPVVIEVNKSSDEEPFNGVFVEQVEITSSEYRVYFEADISQFTEFPEYAFQPEFSCIEEISNLTGRRAKEIQAIDTVQTTGNSGQFYSGYVAFPLFTIRSGRSYTFDYGCNYDARIELPKK